MLALEDLHWADPTSLLVTENLAGLAARGAVVIASHRSPGPRGHGA